MQITPGEYFIGFATITAPIITTLLLLHRQNYVKFKEFFTLLKQFPLHRHFMGKIIYPYGMHPKDEQDKGEHE